jgi:hypothetical protein
MISQISKSIEVRTYILFKANRTTKSDAVFSLPTQSDSLSALVFCLTPPPGQLPSSYQTTRGKRHETSRNLRKSLN